MNSNVPRCCTETDDAKKAEERSADAVGWVEDDMECVDILAGGYDDDEGRSVIADDPEATPPVRLRRPRGWSWSARRQTSRA